jgi:hypothetical protein
MTFLDCPAYLDLNGTVRCGLPAEVTGRFTMRSTDGPLEGARISCPAGHHFNGPIESFTWDPRDNYDPGTAGLGAHAGRHRIQHGHNGHQDGVRSAQRDFPTEPERTDRRPNNAPAYYLSRPAARWIAAMRPRRGPATRHLRQAAVSGGNPP